jgi:hypothetical protein
MLLAGGASASHAANDPAAASVGKFELNADTSMPARIVSFGQIFLPGTVQRGDHLQVILDGHPVPTQVDPKAFNTDGSVRHAILTIELPSLHSGEGLGGTIVKQAGDTAPVPSGAPQIPDVHVVLGTRGTDGAANRFDVDLRAVARDPKNAAPQFWIDGPLAQERRYSMEVGDHLQILFDVFLPRGGAPARVDVIFHNDWTGIHRQDTLNYDVQIALAGATVFEAKGLHQYPFSVWHHLLWTDGKPSVRIAPDLAGLEAAAAVPRYATDFGVGSEIIQEVGRQASRLSDQPMQRGSIDTHMPDTGGRMDIGPLPTYAVVDLLRDSEVNRSLVLGNGDAAGTIPWHLRERSTGLPLSMDAHPDLWLDPRGEDTLHGLLPEPFNGENNGWTIDDAHQPSLTYLPYLLTGLQYYRDELAAQAAYDLLYYDSNYRGLDHGLLIGEHGEAWAQVRGMSWSLRTFANAAFILPADYPMRDYFDAKLRANLAKLVQLYVQDRSLKDAGVLEGWMPGNYRPDGATAPWQQCFLVVVLSWINDMGYPDAGKVAGWMSNFIAGLFTSADQGFDPIHGAAYILPVYDPETNRRFNSWTEAFQKSDLGGMSSKTIDDAWTAYGTIMRAGTGAVYSVTRSPRAEKAYEYASGRAGMINDGNVRGDPTFAIVPRPGPATPAN